MIETLIGSVFGGAFRMAPEILKWLDRKDERKHELAMLDKQADFERLKGQQAIAQTQAEGDITLASADIQAIIEATKAQAQKSGIAWVDAISSLMRPIITFWWVIVMYSVALCAEFMALNGAGDSYVNAILSLWGADEKAIVASIISFWFVDRSMRKGFGK